MNKTMNGPDRPTLSLPFGRTDAVRTVRKNAPSPGILSRREVRRMVLQMLD